ncbi:hypothetical protein Dimus_027473 [Dionaea muscipula]
MPLMFKCELNFASLNLVRKEFLSMFDSERRIGADTPGTTLFDGDIGSGALVPSQPGFQFVHEETYTVSDLSFTITLSRNTLVFDFDAVLKLYGGMRSKLTSTFYSLKGYLI